ncbi:MAG: hypothetical protein ACPLIG_00280 [Candidatus Bathyarchaeales archaeon]
MLVSIKEALGGKHDTLVYSGAGVPRKPLPERFNYTNSYLIIGNSMIRLAALLLSVFRAVSGILVIKSAFTLATIPKLSVPEP